jgi:hypothetical protein
MAASEIEIAWLTNQSGHIDAVGEDALRDAIDCARDQDKVTWLTEDGQRVCAIVPVDVAEADMARRAVTTGG